MEFQYHSGGDTNTRTQFPFLFKTIFLLISSSLRLLRVPPVLSIHLISLTVLNILIWYLLIASYTSALILTSLSSLPASLVYCYFNSSLSMLVSLSGCIPESCCSWSTSPIGGHNPPLPPPLSYLVWIGGALVVKCPRNKPVVSYQHSFFIGRSLHYARLIS